MLLNRIELSDGKNEKIISLRNFYDRSSSEIIIV